MGSFEHLPSEQINRSDEFDVSAFDASAALNLIDKIVENVYLPSRGQSGYDTERAIFVESPHVPHRENNAEHSWHIGLTVQAFWDNRYQLGLVFPDNFDVAKAGQLAMAHDVMETWAGDMDAVKLNPEQVYFKKARERTAHRMIYEQHTYLRGIADLWEEYELKDTPEAQFVSDLDKIAATRVIYLDGGQKWLDWEGYSTTREYMCSTMRNKLLTIVGHEIFDELERDLDNHPEYFSRKVNFIQDRLF